MSLFCPNCSTSADDEAPYCDRCGHDLVPADGAEVVAVVALARRHDVVLDRIRINCVCYSERLRYDPLTETMASVFSCGREPERIDCIGCRVCIICGDLRCTCGLLSISIGVKTKGTVIDTVPVRGRLVAFLFFLLLIGRSSAMARDWYMVMNETNQCAKYSSPAEIIEILQADKSRYRVQEVKQGARLVKVRVIDVDDRTQYVYYPSKSACENDLMQRKQKQQAELKKYR